MRTPSGHKVSAAVIAAHEARRAAERAANLADLRARLAEKALDVKGFTAALLAAL